LLLAHFAIRGLMHEAVLKAGEDPDRLSFLHSVRVVQRRMARFAAIPPQHRKVFMKRFSTRSFRSAAAQAATPPVREA
jgi:hypothetical protein